MGLPVRVILIPRFWQDLSLSYPLSSLLSPLPAHSLSLLLAPLAYPLHSLISSLLFLESLASQAGISFIFSFISSPPPLPLLLPFLLEATKHLSKQSPAKLDRNEMLRSRCPEASASLVFGIAVHREQFCHLAPEMLQMSLPMPPGSYFATWLGNCVK